MHKYQKPERLEFLKQMLYENKMEDFNRVINKSQDENIIENIIESDNIINDNLIESEIIDKMYQEG